MTLKKDIKTLKGKEVNSKKKLKDWKKAISPKSQIVLIGYTNNKWDYNRRIIINKGNHLIKDFYGKGKDKWVIRWNYENKHFKTKPQAVKFAKEYMKKN